MRLLKELLARLLPPKPRREKMKMGERVVAVLRTPRKKKTITN